MTVRGAVWVSCLIVVNIQSCWALLAPQSWGCSAPVNIPIHLQNILCVHVHVCVLLCVCVYVIALFVSPPFNP